MNFILLGISHKTAPVKVRERYSFSKKRLSETLIRLSRNKMIDEVVLLCTCNRTEIYANTLARRDLAGGDFTDAAKKSLYSELRRACRQAGTTNYPTTSLRAGELQYFYFLQNKDVIKHLFRVGAGLDSQVIGESQILGQVKNAYFHAKELGTTGKYFYKLFQKAIEAGKIVHRTTKISEGNISIGTVALRMAENLLGTLNGKKILIIGTGKTGELAAKYLADRGISGSFVANRTHEKAIELAAKIGGRAVGFNNLKNEIKDTDIIISATASPHLILKKEMIREIMSLRRKPLCLMDLALPRDIDPEIKCINNVSLCNLDDFNLIIEENYRKRVQEAKKAEEIIKEEVKKFWKCLNEPRTTPRLRSGQANYEPRLESAPVRAGLL
ncbi:MAG: glutamyl-tRNA reductase [bacterium]